MSRLVLESSAFPPQGTIPRKHTGDGEDASPALAWTGVPDGAKELALVVDDPDAPTPEPWVHWVLYKVPPQTTSLPERVPQVQRLSQPQGALQGRNSWPKGVGYRGPAPPHGHGLHHYRFRLYALDAPVALGPGIDKAALLAAMNGHVLAEAELVGTYQR
ncbi:MAG: YbhB/YbcL family Raf kinase inhibitor-like protein [Planctomycetaceae bacterium]